MESPSKSVMYAECFFKHGELFQTYFTCFKHTLTLQITFFKNNYFKSRMIISSFLWVLTHFYCVLQPASLVWYMQHRFNTQQTYCYCGASGEWYLKMLQCLRCLQWYHEKCIRALCYPLYIGDRYDTGIIRFYNHKAVGKQKPAKIL